jgi:hypothetical protein
MPSISRREVLPVSSVKKRGRLQQEIDGELLEATSELHKTIVPETPESED